MDLYELNNNLEHNQNIPEIHILFSLHLQKKQSRVQKWICYQSLNVQQEPLTDQILKKINTGCLDLYELNNNLEHNQNIPEIHILFSLHLQKKQSRVQKWICYQSLNVQQEPLTDRNTAKNHSRIFGFI